MNHSFDQFKYLTDTYSKTEFHLVMGNHDIMPTNSYQELNIKTYSELIIGNLWLTHEPQDELKEGLYNLAGHIHPGVKLKGKAKYGASVPSFFKFSKKVERKGANAEENTPQQFLGPFLNHELTHSAARFGRVEAKDIKVFNEQGEEMSLKGGRYSAQARAIQQAGGTHGSRIRNFSPKSKKYYVKVRLMQKVAYLGKNPVRLQYFVANLLDPENDAASGFARSKLGKQSIGRPNVGHLLLWYYQVKLPAVIKSHYSHTKVKEI